MRVADGVMPQNPFERALRVRRVTRSHIAGPDWVGRPDQVFDVHDEAVPDFFCAARRGGSWSIRAAGLIAMTASRTALRARRY